MSSLIVKMLIAAGATTLVGCGKKTASSESPTTSPASTTPTGLKATQLVGTWLSACEKDKSGEGATTTIMTFAEKSAVITTNIYTDGECKNIENAFVLNATFTLGGEVNGVSGAKKIDYPVTKAQITPLTGAIASAYNTNRLCGITDWTVNVARDAAGDCELKAGVTHYDIVKLDGTKLTIGAFSGTNDGTTEAKRPISLESTSLTKVSDSTSAALLGSWHSSCQKDGSNPMYKLTTLAVTEKTIILTEGHFTDDKCTISESSFAQSATYSTGSDVSGITGAKTMDFTYFKFAWTALTDDVVTGYNAGSFCGHTDWSKNISIENCPFAVDATTFFDILKIENGQLSFGDSSGNNDGSSSAKRPTSLDSTVYSKN